MMNSSKYICPKCGNKQYELDEMRATGGNFAKIFDVQNKKLQWLYVPDASIPNSLKAQPAL